MEYTPQTVGPLVFFDSGIGGLTVMHEARIRFPNEDIIYYADSKNIPYGTRSSDEIKKLVSDAVHFLKRFKPKALIIACNTATSVIIKELRELYEFPIIGMEPAIKPAAELCDSSKILICATNRTLEEEKLEDLIKGLQAEDRVERMSLQDLVIPAEQADFSSETVRNYLASKFGPVEWKDYNSIVLGCTHFIYYKELIRSMIPNHIHIIDGNTGTVNRIEDLVELRHSLKEFDPLHLFFISGSIYPNSAIDKYLSFLNKAKSDES